MERNFIWNSMLTRHTKKNISTEEACVQIEGKLNREHE
jgi:hypothetical protein